MIIAAILLNVGESTGKWHVNQKCTDALGNIGLNVFLSMALVGLKLWELAAVAGPMLIILVAQTTLMALFATFIDRKSTRLNSSHANISYAVFCLKKKMSASPPT